ARARGATSRRLRSSRTSFAWRCSDHCVSSSMRAIRGVIATPLRMEDVCRVKAVDAAERQHDLGEERMLVRWIDPEGLERLRVVWIDGLEDQQTSRRELGRRESKKLDQPFVGKVLDRLRGEDHAEGCIGQTGEISDPVGLLHPVALRPCSLEHAWIGIDSERLHSALLEQVEKLASAAADIEHGRSAVQQ